MCCDVIICAFSVWLAFGLDQLKRASRLANAMSRPDALGRLEYR